MVNIIEQILERFGKWLPGIFIKKLSKYSIKDHEITIKSGTPPTYPDNYTLRIDEPVNIEMKIKYDVTFRWRVYRRIDNSIFMDNTITRNEGETVLLVYSLGLDEHWVTLEQMEPR